MSRENPWFQVISGEDFPKKTNPLMPSPRPLGMDVSQGTLAPRRSLARAPRIRPWE